MWVPAPRSHPGESTPRLDSPGCPHITGQPQGDDGILTNIFVADSVTVTDTRRPSLESFGGRRIPDDIELDSTFGHPLRLASYQHLVIYLYPGAAGIIRADETPLLDGAQHRGFRNNLDAFTAGGFTVVGLSSQAIIKQQRVADGYKLLHALVSDPDFRLADALMLTTRQLEGVRLYEREILVINGGLTSLLMPSRNAPESHPYLLAVLLRRDPGQEVPPKS